MAEDRDDGERSQDPTQKRLDEALRRGDVVKSQEVSAWFVIGGGTLILMTFGNSMSVGLQTSLRGLIANAERFRVDPGSLLALTQRLGTEVLTICAVPFLVLMLAALAGNMIQHRLVWSAEALIPDFSKVSPTAGLRRLFSKQALINFAKGLTKLVVIGAIMAALLWPQRGWLDAVVTSDPTAIMPLVRSLTLDLLATVVAVLAIVAALDYLWQYRQWFERQKMSLRELRDEFKQTDGDPKIKAKIRQLRHNRAKKRMMAAVPKASVVITNPTHYAVALQYERQMNAPVCVAKGVDTIALKIREIADRSGVPVVEDPPLARALHASVEIDQEIPKEHYRAVAEVISYVMRLNRAIAR